MPRQHRADIVHLILDDKPSRIALYNCEYDCGRTGRTCTHIPSIMLGDLFQGERLLCLSRRGSSLFALRRLHPPIVLFTVRNRMLELEGFTLRPGVVNDRRSNAVPRIARSVVRKCRSRVPERYALHHALTRFRDQLSVLTGHHENQNVERDTNQHIPNNRLSHCIQSARERASLPRDVSRLNLELCISCTNSDFLRLHEVRDRDFTSPVDVIYISSSLCSRNKQPVLTRISMPNVFLRA